MVNAVDQKRPLEMTWSTASLEAGEAEILEQAMAAVIFARLQSEGLIDAKATLDSPIDPEAYFGPSYNDRLLELVGDADGDQQLDIDVYQLMVADLIRGPARPDTVEAALANDHFPGFSQQFLRHQGSLSPVSRRDERSQAVVASAQGMMLRDQTAVKNAEFVETIPGHLATAKDEAIGRAELQTRRGHGREARELLLETGDALLAAGKTAEAKEIYAELRRPEHADAKINGVRDLFDDYRTRGKEFPRGMVRSLETNGSEVKVAPYSHDTTFGAIASRRIAQLETREKLSSLLGREADPFKAADAREYFAKFEKSHSTAEVKQELANYLASFYVHAGEGAAWSKGVAEDNRAGKLDELFADLPVDEAGRKIIDCEGFAAINESVFKDSSKFDMYYVQVPGHVVAAVIDKKKEEMFVVSNQRVIDTPIDPTGAAIKKAAGAAPGEPMGIDRSFEKAYAAIR
jgi:hypothetical protein